MKGKANRRPGGNWSVGRIDKAQHYQTVLYEIDMLRYSYSKLLDPPEGAKDADVWAYLESFLVHYRNLLEFFGKKPKEGTQGDSDLTIARPEMFWSAELKSESRGPSEDALKDMNRRGGELWTEYENRERPDTISRYLQHCTTYRISEKRWHPVEMMAKIKGVLREFEEYLPAFRPATESRPVNRDHFLGGPSVSTESSFSH